MAKELPTGNQRWRVERGIYLTSRGTYHVVYNDPGHKQRSKQFKLLREAREFRARAIADPSSVQKGERPLADVWHTFLVHNAASIRPTTRANWELEWKNYIEPHFGSWPVGRITILDVKDFMAELEEGGAGAATRQKIRTVLGRILEEALENGEISANPVAAKGTRVKMPQPKKARVLTAEEYMRVHDVAHATFGRGDGLAIDLMFLLGLRIGEMCGLQVRDVDPIRGEIAVTRTVSDAGGSLLVHEGTKTNKVRTLPVPTELSIWTELLDHIRDQARIGESHIFSSHAGSVIRPNNWRRRVWAKVMLLAGIEDPGHTPAGPRLGPDHAESRITPRRRTGRLGYHSAARGGRAPRADLLRV